MKFKYLWLLTAVVFLAGLAVFSCAGGDDDDDNNDTSGTPDDDDDDDNNDDNDDNDNDDDNNDDDDDNLVVQAVQQGDCRDDAEPDKAIWDPTVDPTDVIQVTWEDGVLKIEDLFAYVNCCVELDVEVEQTGQTVHVMEWDVGTPCDCDCPIDFYYEIHNITSNNITLTVARDGGASLVEMELELGSQNKKWIIPFIEVFTGISGDPFQVRIAACGLYNLDDQQFFISGAGQIIHVYTWDWYDLDNPGTPNPSCQVPVNLPVESLSPGTYLFGAPSNDGGDWGMLTFEGEIE